MACGFCYVLTKEKNRLWLPYSDQEKRSVSDYHILIKKKEPSLITKYGSVKNSMIQIYILCPFIYNAFCVRIHFVRNGSACRSRDQKCKFK